MAARFTAHTLYKNFNVRWAQDPRRIGPESSELHWMDAQVALAEVFPRTFGLIVCEAIREGEQARRLVQGEIEKNVFTPTFTMDTIERLRVATFTESDPKWRTVTYHIRFHTFIEWLQFTRAVQHAKISAESLNDVIAGGFAQVVSSFPAGDL